MVFQSTRRFVVNEVSESDDRVKMNRSTPLMSKSVPKKW